MTHPVPLSSAEPHAPAFGTALLRFIASFVLMTTSMVALSALAG
ncbi:MAG TPA: hypothetical protein VEZ16_09530 [Microvirga sp.]|nr:hypothetical protein [Microvirga sp.]